MKKLIFTLALVASLASAGLIYPACMIVKDVDGELVTLETPAGDVFQMTGEGWVAGDLACTVMWNGGTALDQTDDIILAARPAGFSAG